MTKFVIHNNVSKTYFGIGIKDGIKRYGFYKKSEDFEVAVFDELESINLIIRVLYDLKNYKSLVVKEVKID